MLGSEFKAGESVTIVSGGGFGHPSAGIVRITQVKKVGVRKMTLADESEWTADGTRPFGGGGSLYYNGPCVRHTEPKDNEQLRRERRLRGVAKFDWTTLNDEDLTTIAVIVNKYLVAAKEKAEAEKSVGKQ